MVSAPEVGPDAVEAPGRLGAWDVVLLAACCGLVSGELEVAARQARRALSTTDQFALMTRHFVWLVPLVELVLFLALGAVWALATWRAPRRAGWWAPRWLITWAVLAVLAEAGRQVYLEAWLFVAMGCASVLAPWLERHARVARRGMAVTVPVLLGLVALQGGWMAAGDWAARRREANRPLPPGRSPNVLLVVLDTVRADHLGLYGYARSTSPNLVKLAERGVRFDQARASAPWTLASHASMFTGRWPHEVGARWMCRMGGDAPTLAEHLGALGYATAGFVGNTFYCSHDSGLDRGFTCYRDYPLSIAEALRTVRLVEVSLKQMPPLRWALSWGMSEFELAMLAEGERKSAREVNGEFFEWFSRGRDPRRPFFAFLNYVDAHVPYIAPLEAARPFTGALPTDAQVRFLLGDWSKIDKRQLPPAAREFARDSYDDCLSYIDEQLGNLFKDPRFRDVLDRTWIIVAADHGEGLGEHGLFDHGQSLYRPETRVPLVIVPPRRGEGPPDSAGTFVDEFVSLRDLPATIAELVEREPVGETAPSVSRSPSGAPPFPGRSLAPFLRAPGPLSLPVDHANAGPSSPSNRAEGAGGVLNEAAVVSELESPNPADPNQGRSPAFRGPIVALAEGDYVYIRNEGDGQEELFNERDDPHELINRAEDPACLPIRDRFRAQWRNLRGQRLLSAPAPAHSRRAPFALVPGIAGTEKTATARGLPAR